MVPTHSAYTDSDRSARVVGPGEIYTAVVLVLLLVGLVVSFPVVKRIFVEGIERRRKWRTGEIERYTEDEEYDRSPPATVEEGDGDARSRCRHCGTANESGYTFCRECGEAL